MQTEGMTHANDCATNIAPAMKPSPCDCKVQCGLLSAVDLEAVLRSIWVTGPDADGLFWVRLRYENQDAAIAVQSEGLVGSVLDLWNVERQMALEGPLSKHVPGPDCPYCKDGSRHVHAVRGTTP